MSCKFPPFQLLTQIAGCHTLKGGIIFWFRFLSRCVIATMKVHVQGFEKGEKLRECSRLTTQSPVFPWAKPGDQTSKGKQKYSVITRGRRVASVCAIRAFHALAMRDLCTRRAPMFQHTIERDGLKRRKRLLTRTPGIPTQRRGFPGISFHFAVCKTALNSSQLAYCIVCVYLHNNQREAVKNLCREKTRFARLRRHGAMFCANVWNQGASSLQRNTSSSAANRETRLLNKIPFNLLSNLLCSNVSYFISL